MKKLTQVPWFELRDFAVVNRDGEDEIRKDERGEEKIKLLKAPRYSFRKDLDALQVPPDLDDSEDPKELHDADNLESLDSGRIENDIDDGRQERQHILNIDRETGTYNIHWRGDEFIDCLPVDRAAAESD